MRNNILLWIAAAALAVAGLAACSEKEEATDSVQFAQGEYPLTLSAQVGEIVRSTALDGTWEIGDSIAVQVTSSVNSTSAVYSYAYDGDAWSSKAPYYWQSTAETLTIDAWFPYSETAPGTITVAADQSTADNYQANDVLLVEGVSVTFGNTATLDLAHQTAKLSVTLSAGEGFETTDLADATVTFNNLSSVEDASDGEGIITAYNSEGTTHLALISPQEIASGTNFITVTVDSKEYYYFLSSDLTLSAGYQYKYSITVNKTGLSVTVTLGEWDDKGTELGSAEASGYILDDSGNYTVYNARGLKAWNKAVQSDLSISCTLIADIDLSGYEWTLVGSYSGSYSYNGYTGTFDGAGHTISGLTIDDSDTSNQGMFSCIGSTGTVKNLTLENAQITSSQHSGSIAGWNYGTISNCTFSGTISGYTYNGGIAGDNYGKIIECYSEGSVTLRGNDGAAGIVSRNYGTVAACYSAMQVYCVSYGGGIVGDNYGPVTACYFIGTFPRGYIMGGIVGRSNSTDAIITACYSTKRAESDNRCGYIVGLLSSGSVSTCYYSTASEDTHIGIGSASADEDGVTNVVDGTDVTWDGAMETMNSALSEYEFYPNTDESADTAVEPLKVRCKE